MGKMKLFIRKNQQRLETICTWTCNSLEAKSSKPPNSLLLNIGNDSSRLQYTNQGRMVTWTMIRKKKEHLFSVNFYRDKAIIW